MAREDSGGARLDDFRVICDQSGFKCWASETVIQWDGARVLQQFCDTRNPQDFVRAVPDNQRVINPRAEAPDTFITTLFRLNVSRLDGDGVLS